MPRKANHRRDNRLGPENRWRQRQAGILAKVFRPTTVGQRLLEVCVHLGHGNYQIPPAVMLDFRLAVEEAAPLVTREDWE